MFRKFWVRTQRLLMTLWMKLRYGKCLKLNGVAGFRFNTEMIIRNGSVSIGSKVGIDSRVTIAAVDGGNIVIGNGAFINRGCIAVSRGNITIGDRCQLGPNVLLYDHDHKFGTEGLVPGYKIGNIVIENNSWIGANVTILRDTHIGEGCVIGAGAVIRGNIPPHSLVTADRSVRIVPIENRS